MSKKILFIAPKAPPVTGLANISNAVAKLLEDAGHTVSFVSNIPNFAASLYPGSSWRIVRLGFFIFVLVPKFLYRLFSKDIVYLNVNGGSALVYDIFFARMARVMGAQIFVHHNSFSYLNDYSSLANFLFRAAGHNATHVVNCRCMRRLLETQYGLKGRARLLSNSNILNNERHHQFGPISFPAITQGSELRVGFMGYYTKEKGIDLFCETIEMVKKTGRNISAVAVGIVRDRDFYESMLSKYGNIVDFLEPQYGREKDDFFASLDVLLFPSRYRTEAEPLVVYDALAAGVAVLGSKVGCLPEILDDYTSCMSCSIDQFKQQASVRLLEHAALSTDERGKHKKKLVMEYQAKVKSKQQELIDYLLFVAS